MPKWWCVVGFFSLPKEAGEVPKWLRIQGRERRCHCLVIFTASIVCGRNNMRRGPDSCRNVYGWNIYGTNVSIHSSSCSTITNQAIVYLMLGILTEGTTNMSFLSIQSRYVNYQLFTKIYLSDVNFPFHGQKLIKIIAESITHGYTAYS